MKGTDRCRYVIRYGSFPAMVFPTAAEPVAGNVRVGLLTAHLVNEGAGHGTQATWHQGFVAIWHLSGSVNSSWHERWKSCNSMTGSG